MLARVAENLYWMTRYMERAEDTARLINAVTLMSLDMSSEVRFGWDTLVRVAGLDELFYTHYAQADEAAVMRFLIQDERNPSSVMSCITHARENTRTFREVLPWECWEWVNELYLYAKQNMQVELDRRRRYEVLQTVIRSRQSIVGLLAGTMSREAPFLFLQLGRNIERAEMTSRILDISHAVILPSRNTAAAPYGDLLWMNILKSLSAYQMYRRYVSVHANSAKVIEFLLKDRAFPRTVAHCLQEIVKVLHDLPHRDAALGAVHDMLTLVDAADSNLLATQGMHEFTDQIQLGLVRIERALHKQYFRSVEPVDAGAEVAA